MPWGPTPATIERLSENEELVAGKRPVEEAFAARRGALRLLVVPERRTALETLVLHATTLRIPVVEVEGGTLTSLAGFDGHQGVALVVPPRRWATLDEIVARARERGEPPLILILDSLEDPQNVGTLLRTAEACGVHGVLFPTRRAAPLSPAAVKASAGAVEHLLLCPVDDLGGALADLRSAGLRLIGADEDAALSYRDADLRGPLALVVGSEAHGLSGPVRRRLDGTVRLPMHGKIASLNASVAGSVLLFEAASQRGTEERHAPPVVAGEAATAPRDDAVDAASVTEPPPPPVPSKRGTKPASVQPEAAESVAASVKPTRKRASKATTAGVASAAESDPIVAKPARRRASKPGAAAGAKTESDGATSKAGRARATRSPSPSKVASVPVDPLLPGETASEGER